MIVSKDEGQFFNKWTERYLHCWIDWGTLNWPYIISMTSLLSLLPHGTLVLLFFHPLHLLLSSPFLSHFLLCSLYGSLLFPFTDRRYLKDQITMATISHIVFAHTCIWWLFLFWRVSWCVCTSLADRQVTCSGEEGTMLPSVGSMCLHTASDIEKHPASLWWLMTSNHMPIKTFSSNQELYGSILLHKFETHLSFRTHIIALLPFKITEREDKGSISIYFLI